MKKLNLHWFLAACWLLVAAARLEGQRFFFSSEQPSNCAAADGIVTIVPTSGTPPFSFAWSSGATDLSIRGVQKGQFSATMTDATGATVAHSHILNSEALDVRMVGYRPASFCNPNSGLLEAEAVAGVAPFSFLWSNGATTATATGLAVGEYGVTVTDAAGCSAVGLFEVGHPHGNYWPQAAATIDQKPTCAALASGQLTATMLNSGYPPYSTVWSTGATTATISGLTAGVYSCTITDALGCSAVANHLLEKDLVLAGSVVCTGQSTGTASANLVGGAAPIVYSWTNGALGQTFSGASISGLGDGQYFITATDANGCSQLGNVQVSVPYVIAQNGSQKCFAGAGGSAYAWVQGDYAPTFLWSNGSTDSWTNGLAPGQHSVTATSSQGCILTGTVTIPPPQAAPFSIATTATPADCANSAGGAMNVAISGGIAPFTFYATGPDGFFSTDLASLQNVASGSYYLSVSATAGGCSGWAEVVVPDAGGFNPVLSFVDLDCATQSLGSAAITGVTAPGVSYAWSNGATTPDIYSLTAGCYEATVTGAGTCLAYLRCCIYGDKDSLQLGGGCSSIASGQLINDLGAAGCAGTAGIPFQVFKTLPSGALNLTDENGFFDIGVEQGPFEILPAQFDPADIACPPTGRYTVNLLPGQVQTGLDFHFLTAQPTDNRVSMRPLRTAQPGYPFSMRYKICNDGAAANAGTLDLTTAQFFGSLQQKWFSKKAGAVAFGFETLGAPDVLTQFSFPNLAAGGCELLQTDLTVPTTTPAATDFFARAAVSPTAGDPTPANNSASLFTTVVGSFDPNSVYSFPARKGNPRDGGELWRGQDRRILYQIYFQNTGTAAANTVIVRDTLDAALDLETISAIEASHEMKVKIVENRVLVFEFPNINLPDSTADFSNSIGSISYEIELKNGLALGTEAKKRAAIYFDFNPPVITNENVLTLVDPLSTKNPAAEKGASLAIFPNPTESSFRFLAPQASVVSVSNALGATVFEAQNGAGLVEIDATNWPSGVYFVRSAVGQTVRTGRVVVQR